MGVTDPDDSGRLRMKVNSTSGRPASVCIYFEQRCRLDERQIAAILNCLVCNPFLVMSNQRIQLVHGRTEIVGCLFHAIQLGGIKVRQEATAGTLYRSSGTFNMTRNGDTCSF